jgi:pilus assembly protein CpaB
MIPMVNKKPLIVAGVMGLLAVLLVFGYIKKVEQSNASKEIQYGKVVVAKEQIPVRTKVKESMLEEQVVPVDAIHPDAVKEIDESIGKVTNQVIFQGEQILNAKFTDEENLKELAFIIDEGDRGVTIGVSDIKGLGGNVKPGDHVDVVGVFDKDLTGVDSAFTILSNVMVKAVGKSLGPEDQDTTEKGGVARTVTVEVTPEQAERLILADEKGSLRLSLRHPEDIYTPASSGTQLFDIVKYTPNPYDKNSKPQPAEQPLPKYPEYFKNTPEPDSKAVQTTPIDIESLRPKEKIRIELIMGGEVQEVFLDKPEEKT